MGRAPTLELRGDAAAGARPPALLRGDELRTPPDSRLARIDERDLGQQGLGLGVHELALDALEREHADLDATCPLREDLVHEERLG